MIGRVAEFDQAARLWRAHVPVSRPEWAAHVLGTLFEAARVHGTTIRVQTEDSQAPAT